MCIIDADFSIGYINLFFKKEGTKMKKMGKVLSIILSIVLVLSSSIMAFAADNDQTGTITINSSNKVSVDGKTFNAYRILDAEAVDVDDLNKGVVYTIPAELQSFYDGKFGGDDGVATVAEITDGLGAIKDDADALQAFAVDALAAAKAAGITPATATGADDSATLSDIPFGYYVIEDASSASPVSALMLQTTSATVTIKADKPSIIKKIDGDTDADDQTEGAVDYNTAKVGETVPYVLTSAVPAMTGYETYEYTVTDTFSAGLTYNGDVKVTIGGEEVSDYTVTYENQVLTISFADLTGYTAGAEIVITYTATVNENAVKGVEGNPNTVVLEYSDNPQDAESTETTPEDTVVTYLVDLIVNKTDASSNALEGAKFELYNGSTLVATGVSGDDGVVVFAYEEGYSAGLKDGETYTLKETEAPAGYNEAEDITFTVSFEAPTADAEAQWSTINNVVNLNEAGDAFEITVVNQTGGLLPSTGGIGTTIFYIVGALLVIGAAIYLISKKRMSAEA